MSEKAQEYYEFQLKLKSVRSFIKYYYISQAENQSLHNHRNFCLLKQTFSCWRFIIPTLISERENEERQEISLGLDMRRRLIYPRIFSAWRSFVEIEKEERLKEQHTQLMWEKVQSWLRESKESV
jgi:hypothetical protein